MKVLLYSQCCVSEWDALSLLFTGANEPVTRMNTACPPDVKLYRATSTLLFLTD